MSGPTQQQINDLMFNFIQNEFKKMGSFQDVRFEKLTESFEGARTTRYWTIVTTWMNWSNILETSVYIVMCEYDKDAKMISYAFHLPGDRGKEPVEFIEGVDWAGETDLKL